MSRGFEENGPEGRGVDADEARLRRAAELVLERELLTGPAPLPDFAALVSKRERRWRWPRARPWC